MAAVYDRRQEVSPDEELKRFISENKTGAQMPGLLQIEAYSTRDDVSKYKEELSARQFLQSADIISDADKQQA